MRINKSLVYLYTHINTNTMIITKEQQEAWVLNYSETHPFDQTTGFIDGMNHVMDRLNEMMKQERELTETIHSELTKKLYRHG